MRIESCGRSRGALASAAIAAAMLCPGTPAQAGEAPLARGELVLKASGSAPTQECSQFAMNLSADAAKVRPLVPAAFVFSRDLAGKAVLGYRVFECRSLRIGSAPPRHVVWSELGVRSLPPEGLPEPHVDQHVDGHDYYVLAFSTPDRGLARALRRLGLRPPGAPRLLARRLSYGVRRLPSASDALGDATLADTLRPVRLEAAEAVRGGSYATTLASSTGLYFRKAVTPYDVREWFVRSDCRVISAFEHKERPTAVIPSIDLAVGADTLIGRLVDRAPDAGGTTRMSSSTDVYVQFDELMTWRVRDAPTPVAPPAYDAVRGLSSAQDGSACAR